MFAGKTLGDKEQSVVDCFMSVIDCSSSDTDCSQCVTDCFSSVSDRSQSVIDKEQSVTDRSWCVTDRFSSVIDRSQSVTDKEQSVADCSWCVTDCFPSIMDCSQSVTDKKQSMTDCSWSEVKFPGFWTGQRTKMRRREDRENHGQVCLYLNACWRRRSRRDSFLRASSCSQMRRTRHLADRKIRVTSWSRVWLPEIFLRQKAALPWAACRAGDSHARSNRPRRAPSVI